MIVPTTCFRCKRSAWYCSGRIVACPECGVQLMPCDRSYRARCRGCRYDLRTVQSLFCPECGRPFGYGQLRALGHLRPTDPRHRLLLALGRYEVGGRRRPRTPHCRRCGYDLRGLTHNRCPECGAPAWLVNPERLEERLRRFDAMALDGASVRSVLPEGGLLELHELLVDAGWSSARSAACLLEAFAGHPTEQLDDEVARRIIPPGPSSRGLYDKLRELGHGPLAAIRQIAPHARSYDGWLNDPEWSVPSWEQRGPS